MLFAEESWCVSAKAGSRNAAFTMSWQSSNVPRTANVRTLPPQHESWCA
jgi:hypothetical protein